jgi:hypothetical protein
VTYAAVGVAARAETFSAGGATTGAVARPTAPAGASPAGGAL